MKKTIALAMTIMVMCSSLAWAQQIHFATNATYPPFVSKDANGQLIGFGIDVVHAICNKLKASCEITDTAWDALIPALNANKYDAIFGGMSITPKRARVVDFTKSYYQNPATYIINKDKSLALTDVGMTDKVIGYQQGNTFKDYLVATYGKKVVLKAYPSVALAFIDVKAGRINALMLDKSVAQDLLKGEKDKQYITQADIYSTKYFGQGNGIAVKKGNASLQMEINGAITMLEQDGTITKLTQKWFA